MASKHTLGARQVSALEIHLLDPVHAEWGDSFPGRLLGSTLIVDDEDLAFALLTDAANACDDDAEGRGRTLDASERQLARADRDALTALASRVLHAIQ